MKRDLFCLLILCLLSVSSFAGYLSPLRCTYDSLITVRNSPEISVNEKINVYFKLADLLVDSLPDRSFVYMMEAYRLSALASNINGKAQGREMMGSYFASKRKYNLALENYLGSLRLYEILRDTTNQLKVLGNIGIIHQQVLKYQEAIGFYKRGILLAHAAKDEKMDGQFMERMALTSQYQKKYDTAMTLFQEALIHYRKAGFPFGEYSVKSNIAGLYMDQRRFEEAMEYLDPLLKKGDSLTYPVIGSIYTRVAHIYSMNGNNRMSLEYNLKALDARIRGRKPADINSSLINIGGDYLMLGQTDSAWRYLNSGLSQARFYHRLGLIENGYRRIYLYYYGKGDFVKALDYLQRKSGIRDTIMLENNSSSLELISATQRYSSIMETNTLLQKHIESQLLNSRKQAIQSYLVEIVTALAAIVVIIVMGQFIYNRVMRRNSQHVNEKLNLEIWERKETQKQTRLREEQFRFILEHSLDVITRVNHEFRHTFASPSSKTLFGYTALEMLSLTPYDVTHPDFHGYVGRKVEEMIRTRSATELVYPAKRNDGSFGWVESILTPVFDHHNGAYKELVAVTRDIQERKSKELEIMEGTKQKENLLKEIHHRVKNNFAILVSLINMQKEQTGSPELIQSLTNLQLRIRSMALVHEMLYRSSDFERISFTDYLHSLASVIAGTYNRREISLKIEADPAEINIETSIPLGLIINEILSNSYKHAFNTGTPGNILLRLVNDYGSNQLTLTFSDDGAGMPKGFNIEFCKTMGLQIVNILVKQIEGTLTLTGSPGTTFTLSFSTVTV